MSAQHPAVALLDQALLDAHRRLAETAWQGGPLEPKVRALVLVAAESVLGGIDPVSLRTSIRNALGLGATVDEIRDVVALTSILGVHSATMGTPMLLEELAAAGHRPHPTDPGRAAEVRADFERRRGYWGPLWEAVSSFSPDFLAAYLDYSSIPGDRGVLTPQVRELVLVVANSVTTHLNPEGLRVHLRNALALGVTGEEIMHVFQLLATLGFRSVTTALPLLAGEAGRSESQHDPTDEIITTRS